MAPTSGFITVAELVATLGLDVSQFDEQLLRSKIKLEDTGREMVSSIQEIEREWKKQPELFLAVAQAYTGMGKTAAQANIDIVNTLRAVNTERLRSIALEKEEQRIK